MMPASSIERHDTDILILGTGGAGMFAALHAQQRAAPGTRITIAVKGLIGKCGCTRMVQGGYNVALGGGLARLQGSVFRIGHLGDLNEPMILGCLSTIEMQLKRQGIPHGSGGVDAAIESLA